MGGRWVGCAVLGVAWLVGCRGAQPARGPGAVARADTRSGIVRIEPVLADGGKGLPLSGLVTRDGRVLTGLNEGPAVGVRIVDSAGGSFESTGIAGYLSSNSLMLLDVNWRDHGAPPALPWAAHQSRTGQKLTLVAAGSGEPGAGAAVGQERLDVLLETEGSTFSTMHLRGVGLPDRKYFGAAVLNEKGEVAGFVHGFALRASFDTGSVLTGQALTGSLLATPVEVLGCVASGRTMTWEEWAALRPKLREADDLREEAYKLARHGKLDDAVFKLHQSLSFDDRSAASWRSLGGGYIKKKEYAKAVVALGRSLELDPTDLGCGRTRAAWLMELRLYEEALAQSERLVALAPGRADMLDVQGAALWGNGRMAEARAVFERALELDPKDEYAREQLKRLEGWPEGK